MTSGVCVVLGEGPATQPHLAPVLAFTVGLALSVGSREWMSPMFLSGCVGGVPPKRGTELGREVPIPGGLGPSHMASSVDSSSPEGLEPRKGRTASHL